MSRLILSAILALLAAAPTPPEAGWQEMLTAAIHRATAQNPRIREAAARVESARHRVPQATALPDPEIEVGLKDAPVSNPSLSRDDFTMEMVTGRQRLPARGKRAAQLAMAQAGVEGAAAMRTREAVEIAAGTADAFFQLAATDRSLAILEESRQRLEDAAAAATERYRVGKTGQSDVLQASLEKTSLDEQLSTLKAERRAQAALFNALQGLPAGAPVPRIGSLPPDFEIPDVANLLRRAAGRNPAVTAAQAEVRGREQELELARLESRPDWTLMSYYAHRERFEDLVGVSAAVSLPWARRGRLAERRAEKEADLAAAIARVEAARNQLQADLEIAAAELEKNVEQGRLYTRSILPQAEINYRAAREAYVVGKVDFLTLVRAATSLDRYRQEAAMRTSGIGRALAALQKASGLPLLPGAPEEGGFHDEK
jgi:outer membrane protein, heavy metal efflux system